MLLNHGINDSVHTLVYVTERHSVDRKLFIWLFILLGGNSKQLSLT